MYFHKGWGSGPGWWRVPVPASQYVHPEFGFLCPTPRFRRRLRLALACLAVAGIGAGVMAAPGGPKLDAALTPVDQASIGDSIPAPSLTPFVGTQRVVVQGAPAAADKPSCVGDTRSERDCGLVKPRKPRMVRVPTDRPAIAAVPLGRIAPPPRASSTRRSPPPAPGNKATRRNRAKQWSPPQARRSLTRRLPHPRRRKGRRTVRRNAAIPTGTALRPGARFGSTIGQRAATHQGSATTGGADTVRPVSGNAGASTFWISPSRRPVAAAFEEPPPSRTRKFRRADTG